ncbi:MAG: hypothetical protein PHQ59_05380 [Candidatus Daviesbacteria bacterium]|nr:hypothetical protein [Candidatus Daviesbacteria bacterium]
MRKENGSVLVFVVIGVVLVIASVAGTAFYLGKGQDALFGFFNGKQNVEINDADTGKTKEELAQINQRLLNAITPTSTPEATIIPIKTATPTPAAVISTINITGLSAKENGAAVEWSGESSNGFKVCYSESANPTYPGSNCTYKGANEKRFETGGLTAGKTYHFRVGAYGLDGKVSVYSNDATVIPIGTTASTTLNNSGALNLSASSNESGKVSMSWTLNGDPINGFKEVWSEHSNPTYPEDHWNYDSDTNLRSYTFSGLPSGQTLHFRVGIYKSGQGVTTYSNDVTVTVK